MRVEVVVQEVRAIAAAWFSTFLLKAFVNRVNLYIVRF